MSSGNPEPDCAQRDADAIRHKFGPFAEVYAENRSEAAGLAGNDAGERHWKSVADLAEDDGQ